jgi:hypothetical protein
MKAELKPYIVIAVTLLAAAAVWVAIQAAVIARSQSQPAQPSIPATVTVGGHVYQCSAVRQAWSAGNYDQYDSYPFDAQIRCTTGM